MERVKGLFERIITERVDVRRGIAARILRTQERTRGLGTFPKPAEEVE